MICTLIENIKENRDYYELNYFKIFFIFELNGFDDEIN